METYCVYLEKAINLISSASKHVLLFLLGVVASIVLLSLAQTFITTPAKQLVETNKTKLVWGVQIGSFDHPGGFNYIRSKLDEDGYRLFETPVLIADKTYYRVWIGEFTDQEQALKASQYLSEHYLIYGFVTEILHVD
ncbi:MAG: hypothetical protein CMF46_04140 [Legionellales bacterium]|nr:hypothetical protein [Legionellales bacterium]